MTWANTITGGNILAWVNTITSNFGEPHNCPLGGNHEVGNSDYMDSRVVLKYAIFEFCNEPKLFLGHPVLEVIFFQYSRL